ncbi:MULTISPECIES: hypothetical protein [Chryseobacterium]|uniref:hypothetical protein n=1 Tax=Chryseobacterium TaxID=59732 RepID=UPI000FA197EC|nr:MULTISPECIES: hypothetical protein [Chryseobacterium]MCS4303574.1 hypothetical protein [Chryseobacterium sp. BIGb0232]ROS10273.1 hypothetical protein EDF65_4153 [Chryseobacterium nakagawai]
MKSKIKVQKLTRDQQKNILGSGPISYGCSGCCMWATQDGVRTCVGYYPPNRDCTCMV